MEQDSGKMNNLSEILCTNKEILWGLDYRRENKYTVVRLLFACRSVLNARTFRPNVKDTALCVSA